MIEAPTIAAAPAADAPQFQPELKLFENHLRLKGRAQSTIEGYLRDTHAFLRDSSVQTLSSITLEIVQKWDDEIAKKSPATRARYRNAVRCFLEYGQSCLSIPQISGLSPLFVPTHDPKIPTQEELLLILNSHRIEKSHPVEFRDAAIVCLIAMTGVRRSELRLLNIGDVFIDKSNFQIIATSPKKQGERRIINFGDLSKPYDISAAFFGKYFTYRLVDMGGRNSHKALSAPLFAPIEEPTRRFSIRRINKILDAATARVHDSVRTLSFVTPHTLRHFFATFCYANGMTIENIRKYMGHANISTTERYIHLAEKITGTQAREHGPMVGLKAGQEHYMGSPDHQLTYFRTLIQPAQN